MTVIGALSSFREPGEMSPHKRARVYEYRVNSRVAGDAEAIVGWHVDEWSSPSHLRQFPAQHHSIERGNADPCRIHAAREHDEEAHLC
jgi:hypothetical protein